MDRWPEYPRVHACKMTAAPFHSPSLYSTGPTSMSKFACELWLNHRLEMFSHEQQQVQALR